MRLYEFTNPTKYLLPEADTADLVEQSKNITTADAGGDAVRRLKKKTVTDKPRKML
jgi:hypothetical protein